MINLLKTRYNLVRWNPIAQHTLDSNFKTFRLVHQLCCVVHPLVSLAQFCPSLGPAQCLIKSMDFTFRCTPHTTRHHPALRCHGMKRDIRKWCKECHSCQSSKIHRHTRAPLVERPSPTARFSSLHVDLVGPLPASQGITYLFTIIDRFTRWPEAIPIPDAHASTCATALVQHWIARTLPLIEEGSSPQCSGLSAINSWALKFTQPQLTIHRQMAWSNASTAN